MGAFVCKPGAPFLAGGIWDQHSPKYKPLGRKGGLIHGNTLAARRLSHHFREEVAPCRPIILSRLT
jgi:hypothetical protein